MLFSLVATLCLLSVSEAATVDKSIGLPDDDTKANCGGKAEVTLSKADQTAILKRHNELRSSVGDDVKMKPMEWSEELAGKAQKMADTCQLRHTYYKNYCPTGITSNTRLMGQNYLRNGYDVKNENRDFAIEVDGWWDEINNYNFENQKCDPGRQCDHYLQMANQNTYQVGCAYKECDTAYANYNDGTKKFETEIAKQFFFVCNYYPPYQDRKSQEYPSPRPFDYAYDCLATEEQKTCNNGKGNYNEKTCECEMCQDGYVGKWCEFQDFCIDEDPYFCPVFASIGHCNDEVYGAVVQTTCPKSCRVRGC